MEVGENREQQIVTKTLDNQHEANQMNMNKRKVKDLDQSYHEFPVMSSNHDAETHHDRVGRSHVVCLDHKEGMELDEKEYYRPSYMFNWLRAAGWDLKDAYKAFDMYQWERSYDQLGLEPPQTIPKDEDDSEWFHLSDYDEMGMSPNESTETKNQDEWSIWGHRSTTWQSNGQYYSVPEWRRWSTGNEKNSDLGCMTPGNGYSKVSRRARDDIDSEDESTDMVCNMIGHSWGSLPSPNNNRFRRMCVCNAHILVQPRPAQRNSPI